VALSKYARLRAARLAGQYRNMSANRGTQETAGWRSARRDQPLTDDLVLIKLTP
jgi:hypothetical protein